MKLEFSRQILEKFANIKFHENPYSGSRVFHVDGQTHRWTQTDMTKIMVAFRNFANAPDKTAIMPYSTAACMFSSSLKGWNYKISSKATSRPTTNHQDGTHSFKGRLRAQPVTSWLLVSGCNGGILPTVLYLFLFSHKLCRTRFPNHSVYWIRINWLAVDCKLN
jgi:hypothetical protein